MIITDSTRRICNSQYRNINEDKEYYIKGSQQQQQREQSVGNDASIKDSRVSILLVYWYITDSI